MNKKEKNRKNVKQNLRNRSINRRYKSTIKTLTKSVKSLLKSLVIEQNLEIQERKKKLVHEMASKFFSFVDKSVKKHILHKNNAARKKSKFIKFIGTNLNVLKVL